MTISEKVDSAISDKGGAAKTSGWHGRNYDQNCKQVIHREQSLVNIELTKKRSA